MDRILWDKNDHPGYSYERAPWALVTGVGPFRLLSIKTLGGTMTDVKWRIVDFSKQSAGERVLDVVRVIEDHADKSFSIENEE